jgi:hypothetical protein
VQLTHVAADRDDPSPGTGSPFWSPDGRRLVHARSEKKGRDVVSNLWTIPADGGSDRRLTNGATRIGPPLRSRDGRSIYYREDGPDGRDYVRIPATGGIPERITRNGAMMAEESWDGRELLYSKREGGGPLFLLSLDGGAERQIEDCAVPRSLGSSPAAFYYVGCSAGLEAPLYRRDLATGRRVLLGMLEKGPGMVMGLTVSPDAKTILYGREILAGSDLLLIENFR